MASNVMYAMVTLLTFLSMESVFALECNVIDVDKVQEDTRLSDIPYTISDCVEFWKKVIGQNITIDPNIELACYTMNLELTDDQCGKLKICGPKGGCKLTLDLITVLIDKYGRGVKVDNSSCEEYSGNTCNFGARIAVPSLQELLKKWYVACHYSNNYEGQF